MALLLPQCAPPESLHHQLTVRQRLSLRRPRKPARATHGAAESSSSTNSTKKAATDRYRIAAGTEPCCNITSPLLMTPRISVRRSSRLRVRKGRWDDAKTDTDMDSAEWINRMLDKNGVVEVDPVTIAKQMQQEQLYHTNSPNTTTNSHYHAANYVSSADASHINPPRSSGFPSKVPLAVVLAAGSAVALAAVAFLLKSLNKQGDETASTSSDSEGSNLSSSFKGDPVAPDSSSKGSQTPPQGTRGNKEALASTAAAGAAGAAAAAGAAILQPGNLKERSSSTPSPPSVSKTGSQGEKSQSPTKDASVTPFFSSAKSSVSDFKPAPPVSRWGDDKFKTIQPFFADDRAAVAPSIPEEQSSAKKSEDSSSPSKTVTPLKSEGSPSSPSKTVTPFFTSAKSSVSDPKPAPSVSRWGDDKFKSVQPFFADEQQSTTKKSEKSPSPSKTLTPSKSENSSSPSKTVTPLKSEGSPSSPSKTVTPFFSSAKSSVSDFKPAPPVSRWGDDKFKTIQPFFADDRAAVAPSIPEEQSSAKKSEDSSSPSKTVTPLKSEGSPSSPSKTVTPFFTSAKSSVADSKPAPPVSRWGDDKFKTIQPFFADDRAAVAPSIPEEQSSAKKSEDSSSPSKTVTPLKSEGSPSSPSKTVTPFFTSAKSSVSDPKPAPSVSRWGDDKFKSVQPFFADEQQSTTKKSEKSPSPSKTLTPSKSENSSSPSKTVTPLKSEGSPSSPSKTVTPFFTSAKSSVADSKPAPPVSRWGDDKFKTIQPFFADDRAAVAPSIPEEQSSAKKSEDSSSPSKTVTPLKSEGSPSSPSKTVTPFFTSAKSSVADSKPAPPVSRWGDDKFKTIQPFFADDRAAVAPSIPEEQSSTKKSEDSSSPSKTGTPFFADEQHGSTKKGEKSPSPSKTMTPSKSENSSSPSKTVTPFFTSAKSSVADSKPAPPVSRWGEDKFKAIQPFFADDRAAVAPFNPEEQSTTNKSEKSPSPSKTVQPFFADEQPSSTKKSESSPSPSKIITPAKSESSPSPSKTVTPFFADEQQGSAKKGENSPSPSMTVTPLKSEKSPSPSKTVTPFFTSAKSSVSDSKPAPPVSRWGEDKFKAIQPFFADDRDAVAPVIPEEQSTTQKSENSSSSNKTVTPFFADEQQGSKDAKESVSVESVPPFFAVNEQQQSSNGPSVKTVTPFFADEQQQTNGSSLEKVIIPFFADEQQQAPGVSQSKGTLDLENVKSFFSDDQVGRPSLAASVESLKPTRIPEDEMAGKPQDQHQEFLNPEEFAALEEIKAEEERRLAKMQALQAAFPALAIGAGAVGALAGVDGALEMVGVTATASFISYELLWANKRNELLDEISRITDHHQLFRFLQKRKVLKDDC